ncbi:Mak10 subunit, NatC N-terminal acetyltransferase-domain-containing protein [Absidia repens]|uniref:Mak10 subunit, NatC N-terminal acetyltransferase-domain-containing protein n=1 Tax=Absidia repens TaxID=90262 RepID=A0A1X2IFL0_9FUNG|nr:Mak10 subunit, NatC N-terminal acetyltransferase-domain-containing protein [Absidia repens]
MEEGELIHLQSFTLFDAMGAIEIMDPRMDTGMVIEDSEPKRSPYEIQQALSPSQVIWIMDRLLACEMTWLSGHSLAQTVYTCIYFHHVRDLQNQPPPTSFESESIHQIMQVVLKAYILGSVKCCYHIWNEMVSGNIFEEEDFTTNLFGLSLHEDIMDIDVLNDILVALRMLERYMDSNKSEVLSALHQRLLLRQLFLQSLLYLNQPQCTHINSAQATLSKICQLLDDSTTKDTTTIFSSLELAQEVEGAFDPNIHRKLTSQAPPRSISLQTHQQSYQDFSLIAKRLESICSITKFPSVASLMNYFASFATAQPYADAFSRSKLNSLFYSDGCIFGTHLVIDLVKHSIFDHVQPPLSWFQPVNPDDSGLLAEAKSSLHKFLEQTVALPFVDFFKIQCHNRARQRRILCKVLGDWEIIQDEALYIDKKFQDVEVQNMRHFSLWVYSMKMKMMEQILLLGFELDLYGEGEYTAIYRYYWYLQSVFDQLHQDEEHNDGGGYGINSSKSRINDGVDEATLENRQAQAHYTQCLNNAKKSMAMGTFKLLLAVKKNGWWKQQQLRFDDPQTRFNHRLKPFVHLSLPPFPGFDWFKNTTTTDYVITDAADDFLAASKVLKLLVREPINVSATELCHDASQKVLLSMMKTCVTNNIAIQQLSQLDNSKDIEVTLAFKHHPWWLVVQLNK